MSNVINSHTPDSFPDVPENLPITPEHDIVKIEAAENKGVETRKTLAGPRTEHPAAEAETAAEAAETITGGLTLPDQAPTFANSPERLPTIAGYEVIKRIGEGGMGVVYQAVQNRLGRICAIKMLHLRGSQNKDILQRFWNEAKVISKIQHPNIVQIHNVGDQDGVLFLELEFVEGDSLADQLDGKPWPPAKAAHFAETLARAIAVLHEQNIIHRDIKPANILMDKAQSPKIADFGLAKYMDAPSQMTQSGDLVGTPEYMSPEQASGNIKTVGPRTDIHAIGVILYEILTGRRPFVGANLPELIMNITMMEPIPLRKLVPTIPKDLETICLTCLQKPLHSRYFSAAQLAEDLARFLRRDPIVARPAPIWEKALRWSQRNPLTSGLLGGFLIVVVSAFLLITRLYWQADEERKKAEDLAVSESLQHDLAESLRISANTQAAALAFDKGGALADKGRIPDGLLWMARSLELYANTNTIANTDSNTPSIQQNMLLNNLASWSAGMVTQQAKLAHPQKVQCLAYFEAQSLSALSAATEPNPVIPSSADPNANPPLVVTGCDDGALRIWHANSFALLTTIPAFTDPVHLLAISSDGKVLAATAGNQFQSWSIPDGKPLQKPVTLKNSAVKMTFHPTLHILVVRTTKPECILINLNTPESATTLDDTDIADVVFLPDGRIATSNYKQDLKLWNAADGKLLGKQIIPNLSFMLLCPHPWEKQLLASGSEFAGLSNYYPGVHIVHYENPPSTPTAKSESPDWDRISAPINLKISPQGDTAAVGSATGALQFIRYPERKAKTNETAHNGQISNIAYSPDGLMVATAGRDGAARVWSPYNGRALCPIITHGKEIFDICFAAEGRSLITTSDNGDVRVWDISAILPDSRIIATSAKIQDFDLNPRGDRIALACDNGDIPVYNPITGVQIGLGFGEPPDASGAASAIVRFVRFSPDGAWLLAGGDSRYAHIRAMEDHRQIVQPLYTDHWALNGAFRPDGRGVLIGRPDAKALLWDLIPATAASAPGPRNESDQGYREQPVFVANPLEGLVLEHKVFRADHEIWDTQFTPDGRMAITGDRTGGMGLWDVAAGKSLRPPGKIGGNVHQILVNPHAPLFYLLVDNEVRTFKIVKNPMDSQIAIEGPLPAFGQRVNRIALSPDGRTLITCQNDGVAQFWDPETLTAKDLALVDGQNLIDAIFQPGGALAATIDFHGVVRFWDALSAKPIGPAYPPPFPRNSVTHIDRILRFTPDGQFLVTLQSRSIVIHRVPKTHDWTQRNARARVEKLTGLTLHLKGADYVPQPLDHAKSAAAAAVDLPTIALDAEQWDQRLVEAARGFESHVAMLWHLDRLRRRDPKNMLLAQQQAVALTALVGQSLNRGPNSRPPLEYLEKRLRNLIGEIQSNVPNEDWDTHLDIIFAGLFRNGKKPFAKSLFSSVKPYNTRSLTILALFIEDHIDSANRPELRKDLDALLRMTPDLNTAHTLLNQFARRNFDDEAKRVVQWINYRPFQINASISHSYWSAQLSAVVALRKSGAPPDDPVLTETRNYAMNTIRFYIEKNAFTEGLIPLFGILALSRLSPEPLVRYTNISKDIEHYLVTFNMPPSLIQEIRLWKILLQLRNREYENVLQSINVWKTTTDPANAPLVAVLELSAANLKNPTTHTKALYESLASMNNDLFRFVAEILLQDLRNPR